MTGDREKQSKAAKAEARQARLAQALRANLRKRKAPANTPAGSESPIKDGGGKEPD